MPLYEYECRSCHNRFEALQALGASAEELDCPSCGGDELDKLLSTFAAATSLGDRSLGDSAFEGCGAADCCRAPGAGGCDDWDD